MTRTDRRGGYTRSGFTLVEMLVVISIIVVLVAILFPAFQTARQKARQTNCQSNLQKLATALHEYKRDNHRFPPRPTYNATAQKYTGGFSALYPKYISDYSAFVCPDDKTTFGKDQDAKDRVYCTYNGVINMADNPSASEPWDFAVDADTNNQKITYNYHGYDYKGWDRNAPLQPPNRPGWLERGWKYYPRLINIYAPEYTMITHCTQHRDFYSKEGDVRDVMIQLSMDTDTILVQTWQTQDANGYSLFQKQD